MPRYTVSLAANGEYSDRISGRCFTVLSCTSPFYIERDQNGRELATAGTKLINQTFRRITLSEFNGETNDIVFYAGESDYSSSDVKNVVTVSSQDTFLYAGLNRLYSEGSPWGMNITNGSFIDIPKTVDVGGIFYARAAFHVNNTSGGDLLVVNLDSAGDPLYVFDFVRANTDREFGPDYPDVYRLYNRSGVAVPCSISLRLFSKPI